MPGGLLDFQTSTDALVFVAFCAGWLAYCVISERASRRLDRDRDRCVEAERAAAQADRIAQVTAALSHARSPAAVVEATVQEPLHALKADAALMVLFAEDGPAAEIARAVGYRPEEREAREATALGGKTPASDAIGRGAPVVIESPRAYAAEYPNFHGPDAPTAFKAIAAVPLLIGSRVVAVVQFEFREPRVFTTDDREYLFMLGPRAAQALDRTWQHESALRARTDAETLRARAHEELAERETIEYALRASETRYRALAARTSRLHDLAAALSEAVTPRPSPAPSSSTAASLSARPPAKSCCSSTTSTVRDAVRRRRRTAATRQRALPGGVGLLRDRRRSKTAPAGVRRIVQRAGRSGTGGRRRSRPTAATCRRRRCRCSSRARAIGVLAFHFTVPVNFDDDYQALLVSVAQHCAQALDRARLYESTQRARAEAENANRIKDEFVSIVSHELRTPLNAMLGWTSMLQSGIARRRDKSARALQSIHDNASRQAQLIEELLDFSRVTSGRMSLDMDEIDLRELLRGVVESDDPVGGGQGTRPRAVAGAALSRARRSPPARAGVLQPARQRAEVHAATADASPSPCRAVDGSAEIRVSDTGAGIDPAFLPHVFDRFRQADSHTAARTAASGLACRSPKSSSKRTTAASPPRAPAPAADRPSSSACRSPPPLKRRFAVSNRRLGHPRGRSSISERICSPTASQA